MLYKSCQRYINFHVALLPCCLSIQLWHLRDQWGGKTYLKFTSEPKHHGLRAHQWEAVLCKSTACVNTSTDTAYTDIHNSNVPSSGLKQKYEVPIPIPQYPEGFQVTYS